MPLSISFRLTLASYLWFPASTLSATHQQRHQFKWLMIISQNRKILGAFALNYSPLSGKSATGDLNHGSLCIVGFYTTHYPLCYRRKYGLAYMHLCFNPHCCDSFASGYFGHWELSQRNHKPHQTLWRSFNQLSASGSRKVHAKAKNMNKPYTPNCRCCIPIRSRLERIYIAPLCDSHSLSRLRVQGIW